jgi:hypothetical protein
VAITMGLGRFGLLLVTALGAGPAVRMPSLLARGVFCLRVL